MTRKISVCIALALIFSCVFSTRTVLAIMAVNSAGSATTTSIDIKYGLITGEKVGYYLKLPESVIEYIFAERVVYKSNQPLIEKINIYCKSDQDVDRPESPQPLITLYAYKKFAWNQNLTLDEIFRTKDYVFAYEKKTCGFTSNYNRTVFNYCQRYFSTIEKMKELLVLPAGQTVEFYQSVFVKTKLLEGKVQLDGALYLVPLREVCETLGYSITWNASKSTVTVSKGAFLNSYVVTPSTKYIRDYKIKNILGRIYISAGYFSWLGKNVEVDFSKNVYITD